MKDKIKIGLLAQLQSLRSQRDHINSQIRDLLKDLKSHNKAVMTKSQMDNLKKARSKLRSGDKTIKNKKI